MVADRTKIKGIKEKTASRIYPSSSNHEEKSGFLPAMLCDTQLFYLVFLLLFSTPSGSVGGMIEHTCHTRNLKLRELVDVGTVSDLGGFEKIFWKKFVKSQRQRRPGLAVLPGAAGDFGHIIVFSKIIKDLAQVCQYL